MAAQQIKFENSPADSIADSFVSTPGSHYPPLFDSADPTDVMTPPFDDNSSMFDEDCMLDGSMMGSMAGTPAPEKKPTKKRKSWGQQLPEPKTNLPPRKRAKTEDEKEQRRVERVLRNRRAAQSSRERKRMEVEALEAQKQEIERKNRDLELRLANAEAQNLVLQQQIAQITGGNVPAFKASTSTPVSPSSGSYRQPSPLTLSQPLFNSTDSEFQPSLSEAHSNLQSSIRTVNPASLSPEVRPVDESSNANSSDMTQHPAAMLCDLQCQSVETRPWMASSMDQSTSIIMVMLSLISMTASSTSLMPLLTIVSSLRTSCPISPTQSILNTIIWLTTTPMCLSTSTTSSTQTQTPRSQRSKRFSLRMNLLRRLLACSPQLARPLMDATMGAMRLLASEQQTHARDCLDGGVSAGAKDFGLSLSLGHSSASTPSMECLMTLLWATKVIDRQNSRDSTQQSLSSLERNSTTQGIRRASNSELKELFRPRSVKGVGSVSLSGLDLSGKGKSMDGWRSTASHQ